MNVTIKKLSSDPHEIRKVQKFLFKMIKKEFGYGYVPKWHKDIVNLEDYYIAPKRNNFLLLIMKMKKLYQQLG